MGRGVWGAAVPQGRRPVWGKQDVNPVSGARKMELRRMVPKDENQKLIIWGIETASCLRKTIEKGGKRSPPPFLMGSPQAGKRFDTKKLSTVGFYLSAPFGAAPFYGYPTC